MNAPSTVAQGLLGRFLSRLRFPTLFLILAGLFLLDFVVPDFVPFLDEILLGLLTAMFALIRNRRAPAPASPPPPVVPASEKDVTPR
jgi:hypothetical protein